MTYGYVHVLGTDLHFLSIGTRSIYLFEFYTNRISIGRFIIISVVKIRDYY